MMLISCGQGDTGEKGIRWAEGMVWYQVFPERFYNASHANDPVAEEVPGAQLEPGWQIHPWTSDWYALQPWEKAYSDSFYTVVFNRRFGGDLIGVIQRLDYLKSLGVEGIYFNPVFESPSLHKYDASTYHHIDDNFGPDPARDKRRLAAAGETEDPDTWIWTSADSAFLRLIREAHARNMKIVIDGVWNHTGDTFFAMQDLMRHGKESRYADWYEVTSWDDPDTPENEFDYEGWWGYKTLPVLAENDSGIVEGPREYIFDVTRRWMDPNGDGDPGDGVDGWRLDVAEEVEPAFWRDWYAHVKSINPSAITVAEIWGDASEWIADQRMDGTMNYLFARAVKRFFIDQDSAIGGEVFANRISEIEAKYGQRTLHRLWNLMDSHDTDRLPSMIVNPDHEYDQNNSPRWNPAYKVRKPNQQERQVQKQIAAFQMVFPGAPMIYYGDEVGMWGADDPDDRKPMVWPEMEFAVERHHPLEGKTRPADPNYFDTALLNYYKTVINLRRDHPSLRTGEFHPVPELISEHTYGFKRTGSDDEIVAVFNRSDERKLIRLPQQRLKYSRYVDPLEQTRYEPENEMLQLTIPADWFIILISNSSPAGSE